MTRATKTILSMATGILFTGAIAGAQAQDRTAPPPSVRTAEPGRMGAGAGGDADRMITDQLRSFAQDPRTAPDKLFVLHAAMGNQEEIELSRQAVQKASNNEVKQAAQHILDDHQKAQQQLQQVAQQVGVQLPSSLPEDKQQMIRILTSLPADQFEKHYISAMQADHAKEIIKFRACSQLSQNDQVKQYAQQQLPALQSHYDMVQQAAVALGLPGGSEAIPASGRMDRSNSGTRGDMNDQNRTGGTGGTTGGTGSNPNLDRQNTGAGGNRNP